MRTERLRNEPGWIYIERPSFEVVPLQNMNSFRGCFVVMCVCVSGGRFAVGMFLARVLLLDMNTASAHWTFPRIVPE